jgi:hypothetical protein
MKEMIRINIDIAADIAKALAAAISNVSDPRTAAALAPLFGLMEKSGAEVLRAASSMEFELHWIESISGHARQTIRSQLESEMRSQVKRTLRAQAKAMVSFQAQCIVATLNSISEQMKGAVT